MHSADQGHVHDCETCWEEHRKRERRAAFLARWNDPRYEFIAGDRCLHAKGASCYSLDRMLKCMDGEGPYLSAQLLTREQSILRLRDGGGRPRLRRCRACCPDIHEPPDPSEQGKRRVLIKLTGLGWPIGDANDRCVRTAADNPIRRGPRWI